MNYQNIRYWASQIFPPLLLLLCFNTYGVGMVLFGFSLIPIVVIASVISILRKLFRKQFHHLLRPCLATIICACLFGVINYSMNEAKQEFLPIVEGIQRDCQRNGKCPVVLPGWEKTGPKSQRRLIGGWIKYPVSYYSKEQTFSLQLYYSVDLHENYTGGVDTPLVKSPDI